MGPALPLWIGAVAFLAYNGVLFLFATPFDDLFLVYVAMLGLAAWSIVALLHGLDVERFASLFDAQTPVRPVSVYVWVIVALNTLAWLAPVLRATAADGPPSFLVGTGMTTNPIFVQDLVFWLPAMALGAAWLWRRAAWGTSSSAPASRCGWSRASAWRSTSGSGTRRTRRQPSPRRL